MTPTSTNATNTFLNTTKALPPLPHNETAAAAWPGLSPRLETRSPAEQALYWEQHHSRRVTPRIIAEAGVDAESPTTPQSLPRLQSSTHDNQPQEKPRSQGQSKSVGKRCKNLIERFKTKLVVIPEGEIETTFIPKPQEPTSQKIATRPVSESPLYFSLDDEDASRLMDPETQSPAEDLFGPLLQAREYYYGLQDECPLASNARPVGPGSDASAEKEPRKAFPQQPSPSAQNVGLRYTRRNTSILNGQLLSPQGSRHLSS
ncbi:hypothetical protein B0H11DRAFT_1192789 [Mycena galericulata]|nr:hypothetical protein B0H11DRAFT_1192789 [Mycena galericulata]